MADEESGEPDSPERKALEEARAAAKQMIDAEMHEAVQLAKLKRLRRFLQDPTASEPHRFSTLVECAVDIMGEDPILDFLAIGRPTLNRWIEGQVPGPFARMSKVNNLEQMCRNRIE